MANIDAAPLHKKLFEYGFPRGMAIGYPSTVPPPLVAMMRSAPRNPAFAIPSPPPVAVDEEARNPSVGRSHIQLAVPSHSGRQLGRRSELTPPNDVRPIV